MLIKCVSSWQDFFSLESKWEENQVWASLTVVCCSFSWLTMVGSSLLLAMRSLKTCSLYLVMMSSNADWCSSSDVRSSVRRVNTGLVCAWDNSATKHNTNKTQVPTVWLQESSINKNKIKWTTYLCFPVAVLWSDGFPVGFLGPN